MVCDLDVSQSSVLGFRICAKTLALKKLQVTDSTTTTLPEERRTELVYLQLYNRRIDKKSLNFLSSQNPNSKDGCSSGGGESK